MAAKDKTPNRTLSLAISQLCGVKDCEAHGTVSKSVNGIVERRCVLHIRPQEVAQDDYMLRFLGLI